MMNEIEIFNCALFSQMNGGDNTPIWLVHVATGIAQLLPGSSLAVQ